MCKCNSSSCSSGCGCGCQSCGCGGKSQCCSQKSGPCGSGDGDKSCNYAEKFLELADQAWMEVLKEKIKDSIRSNDKKLDELAHLITEANHDRWQKKIESKKCCGSFDEKLKNFFKGCCDQSCSTNKPKGSNH